MIGLISLSAILIVAVDANVIRNRIHRNNVCKTFPDYTDIDNSKNCFYNPDAESTPVSVYNKTTVI